MWNKLIRNKIKERPDLLVFLNNSKWLVFEKVVRLIVGLTVGALVARYLGPSQFGELAYALAYIAFFQTVSNLGLDGIAVREISQKKNQTHSLLGTIFAMRLGTGILCWLVAIIGMILLEGIQDSKVVIIAVAGGILIFQAADTVDIWFQSQSQNRRSVLVKISGYLISNGIKIALILMQAPLLTFAIVILLEALIIAFGLAVAYRSYPSPQPWQREAKIAKKLIKECSLYVLSGISIIVYMRIDQIMIKEIMGIKELGVYAAVLPIATSWQFITMTLNISLQPFVARKKAESEVAYWIILQKIFQAYSLIGWLICIPIAFLSEYIILFLYGEEYRKGAEVLSIYIFAIIFINMGIAQNIWIINERRGKILFINTLIGAAVCVLGNFMLIPRYGINGAAISAVFAQIFSTVLMNVVFSRRIFLMQIRSIAWPFYVYKEIR